MPVSGAQTRGSRQNSANAGGTPREAAAEKAPFSKLNTMPNFASQMRMAFSSMALNTGCKSPGELEMTVKTSDVAVCCSSDSESSSLRFCTSSNSRTFSIAITAWSANALISATSSH